MKFRTTFVLLLLVTASLCILFFHTARQFGDRKHREQQLRVFPTRELLGPSHDTDPAFQDKVNRITIEGGKERIVLVQDNRAPTATWRIEEPFQALADPAQINAVIKAIEMMQATVILRDEPGSPLHMETYGLAEPSRNITFDMGEHSWTVHVGNATADAQNAYVTRPGLSKPQVYIVPLEHVAPFFLKGPELRDNVAIRFVNANTDRIEIRASDEPAIKCRRANAEWTLTHPVSDIADMRAIQGLLNTLSTLHIEPTDFVTDANARTLQVGLDHPSLTLILADETGELSLTFGTAVANRNAMVYAKRSGDGAIFALPRASMEALHRNVQDMRCKAALPIWPDAVTSLSLSGTQQFHLKLTGETWEMTSPAGYIADGFLVRAFLEDLARTPVTGWIDEPTPEQLKETGLDKPRATLKIGTGDTLPERTLLLGSLTPDDRLCHARRSSSAPILLIPDRTTKLLAEGPLAFLSKTALEFNRDSASAIHIKDDQMETTLEKRNGVWTMPEPQTHNADPALVDEILWALCYIQAHDLLPSGPARDAEYGLVNPRMVVTISLSTAPSEQKTLMIGKDRGNGSCYARVGGVGNTFVISDSVFKTLLKVIEAGSK